MAFPSVTPKRDGSGNADIWEMGADGSGQVQLTAGAGRNYAPVASPDGRYVLFHSNRSGAWQIWRMNRDGSNPRQATHSHTATHCSRPTTGFIAHLPRPRLFSRAL